MNLVTLNNYFRIKKCNIKRIYIYLREFYLYYATYKRIKIKKIIYGVLWNIYNFEKVKLKFEWVANAVGLLIMALLSNFVIGGLLNKIVNIVIKKVREEGIRYFDGCFWWKGELRKKSESRIR